MSCSEPVRWHELQRTSEVGFGLQSPQWPKWGSGSCEPATISTTSKRQRERDFPSLFCLASAKTERVVSMGKLPFSHWHTPSTKTHSVVEMRLATSLGPSVGRFSEHSLYGSWVWPTRPQKPASNLVGIVEVIHGNTIAQC